MPKKYKENSYHTRMQIFELIQKYQNNNMSVNDALVLCRLIINKNPYTYYNSPSVSIEKLNSGILAQYDHISNMITINLTKINEIINHSKFYNSKTASYDEQSLAKKLYSLFTLLGHEMKHYFQYNKSNKVSSNSEDDYSTYLKKIKGHLTYSKPTATEYKNSLLYVKEFVMKNVKNSFVENLLPNDLDKIANAFYLKNYHEIDARHSGTLFAYGMFKTMYNDCYAMNYSGVRSLLKSAMNVSEEVLLETDGNHIQLDKIGQKMGKADKYCNELMVLFLRNKIKVENVQKLKINQRANICQILAFSEDTDSLKYLIKQYNETAPEFANSLYTYTHALHPEIKFEEDELPETEQLSIL